MNGRLKPEKESVISSDVFWSLIQFYYVVKPNLQNFESFFNFFSAAIPFLRPTSTHSSWLSSQLIAYAQQFLTPSFSLPSEVKLNALRGDTSFIIPSLGTQSHAPPIFEEEEQFFRVSSSSHRATNSSLQKTMQFQGFDINDFADLREAHDWFVDEEFIAWAAKNGVCSNTMFRRAYRQDIPWLLKVNTINPTFSKEQDYSGTFYEKNEFVIVAERRNAKGERIPVGMVHYYLMWYYPCVGKDRDAVRAVYVCTLQKVTPETHAKYIETYGASAEPLTGSVLLSLAFLHGQKCQMTMGCCDSTDNSVSFYTSQYGMKALPKGEGKHYTPMQISLVDFDAKNILLQHMSSSYRGTLLCTLASNSDSQSSNSNQMKGTLHLQISKSGKIEKSEIVDHYSSPSQSAIQQIDPHWLRSSSQSAMTDIGRSITTTPDSISLYIHNEVPHFVEPSTVAETFSSSPLSIRHAMFVKSEGENVVISDGNELERELEHCQEELFHVMKENEALLGKLTLSLAQSEQSSEESLTLKERCEKLHDEVMKYTREKHPDLVKTEEEDDDAICEVCGDGDSDYGNMILFCDGCNATVHQCCYDLTRLPQGDWFCNVCEDILVKQMGVRDVLHVTPKNTEASEAVEEDSSMYTVLDRLHELRAKVHCCICGFSKGAMMPTLNEGEYAHVACALWHPYCSVTNTHPKCACIGMEAEVEMGTEFNPASSAAPTANEAKPIEQPSNGQANGQTNEHANGQSSDQSNEQSSEQKSIDPSSQLQSTEPQPTEPQPTPQPPPIPSSYSSVYISPYTSLRSDPDRRRYLIDTSRLGSQRRALACQLCRHRGGVIPCCCAGCTRGVHAMCAIEYQLEMFWNNKIGRNAVPVEDVLVDKDFFMHCWQHSGGFQGRSLPRMHCEDWVSPIGGDELPRKKVNDDYEDPPQPVRKRGRPRRTAESNEDAKNQGLERMRKRRERRKQRAKQKLSSLRRKPNSTTEFTITRKPRSQSDRFQQAILLWLKDSHCGRLLLENDENVLLKIQALIDEKKLPIYGNWKGYSVANGTIQAFFRHYRRRSYYQPQQLLFNIREIYLSLLSYCYPSVDAEKQAIAKLVMKDALELTDLTSQLLDPDRFRITKESPEKVYCVCRTLEWENTEFLVQCDGCGMWFHSDCLGYAECKYLGFLTMYGGRFVDVNDEAAQFYCPNCCVGDTMNKMTILTEEEVIARGGQLNPGYVDPDAVPANQDEAQSVQSSVQSSVQTNLESSLQPSGEEKGGAMQEGANETDPFVEKRIKIE